jgi:hypothetical protein
MTKIIHTLGLLHFRKTYIGMRVLQRMTEVPVFLVMRSGLGRGYWLLYAGVSFQTPYSPCKSEDSQVVLTAL